ncbi:uncharacterized protein FOMMEDRAFT_167018 [Fomitiporia mediterranea MF3/22]|uniref:uncharacterized protein n=1 Tax=Fomitiporia mediterranea (strain MF3/22) TaxID=694068 RepID=UPI0004408632|nr:uncharacterized protein FOMMEDRAFT_167018 [Fomitiporia mediterranea MF3/22]EJD03677.1 hypothetical protein FOMMEDRAFT_167018 [Fomitiporia mediterranea MF3/22]
MPPDTPQKLTKKQRKSLAFRQKTKSKKGGKKSSTRPEPEDVPEIDIEILDAQPDDRHQPSENNSGQLDELTASSSGGKENKVKGKEKEKQVGELGLKPKEPQASTKKRKRTEAEEDAVDQADSTAKPKKKRKGKTPETDENASANSEENEKPDTQKSRYILFVGNLKYTTSKEAIQAHFAHCDPPPIIRLLTPKPTKPSPSATTKSKGCAFLEFTHRNALQQALKLHHSTLDGRQINVELTAGGGGKSATRLEKVRVRNRGLEVQRTKRQQKTSQTHNSTETNPADNQNHSQRHSTTSGTTQTQSPTKQQNRTWSIPEDDDSPGTHRGGVKKRGSKKKSTSTSSKKEWGTGVNAIPVG